MYRKRIMLKYAELNTKKDNINMFIKKLKENILTKVDCEVTFDHGRMFIDTLNFDETISKLKKIFGIHEIVIVYEVDKDLETLSNNIINMAKSCEFKTFKVETKRSDKSYPLDSVQISKKLGGVILSNINDVSVDVHNPEKVFYVEIRKEHAYIYHEKISGLGGYPVGTLGKGLLMISGGLDSPVAGFLAMKRGIKLEAVYFESPPHTSVEAKEKVKKLLSIISEYGLDIKLHVIPFTKIQEEILKNIPHDYLVTIMRRMMYRISESIARHNNDLAIINGESIGQVASQTLTSMNAINEVVSIPVIRPLACFDKLEIIDIAEKIGTYNTSILPYEDCCTIFVPTHPVINPDKNLCKEYEEKIPYEELIKDALKNQEIISNLKEETFKEYL